MTVVAFVPAKSSSERIANKNKFVFDGEPLFIRKLNQLLACDNIDEVWLDTDSDEFINMAADLPIKVLKRDPQLATNSTDGHALFYNEVKHVSGYATIVIQALCTAPFLGTETIWKMVDQLSNATNGSLLAVTNEKQYTWCDGNPNYGSEQIPNSVDLPTTIVETMNFYAVKRDYFETEKRFSPKPILYELNPLEALDINLPQDLDLANSIQSGFALKQRNKFDIIKNKLTTAILGDICKEIGIYNTYLPKDLNLKCGRKIMGYARPLKLRLLTADEKIGGVAWKGIYQGLDHYDYVSAADIVVIENKTGFAYFGDLNCRVAMSKGVNGAIVEGATRDVNEVSNLGFSVAAQYIWSNDVKFEATVDTINKKIDIGNVTINPGDLMFSDYQGTLCIPRNQADQVLKKALEGLILEDQIERVIIHGHDLKEAIDTYGVF